MVKPLFNEKTIKKLCSEIPITDTQRECVNRWFKLIKENKLNDEKKAYIEFAETILQKLLNYDISIESLHHEEQNMEFSFLDEYERRYLVIEVKGMKVKDLNAIQSGRKEEHKTPILQLWDYMSKEPIPFGIATNYRRFVLIDYYQGKEKRHEFDFMDIEGNDEKLREFIGIFSCEYLKNKKFTNTLIQESLLEENKFSEKFYNLYHETRLMLIQEFLKSGLKDKNPAIKYAQIFLNRLVFIYFAEDSNKMPSKILENTILTLLKVNHAFSEKTDIIFQCISKLMGDLDKGTKSPIQITGFNGNFFHEQIPTTCRFADIRQKSFFKNLPKTKKFTSPLNSDAFSEELMKNLPENINPIIYNIILMALFDFKTEVPVNILGHIFEQSISDLEELKGQKVLKRKKQGIYYTPEYVTDFICRKTIIPYLSEDEKIETIDDLILKYKDDISELEEKVVKLKILDCACGSGAFLVKAGEILLQIRKEIEKLKKYKKDYLTDLKKRVRDKKKRTQGELKFFDLKSFNDHLELGNIAKNNLFGVDLNEESVEITKLSLFLKIAELKKSLINLDQNIKVGNSLFDDSFDWRKEFPEIMKSGGFDIIIGNPPYVDIKELDSNTTNKIFENYETTHNRMNLYSTFIDRSLSLLKHQGYFGYIIPNSLLYNSSYKYLRYKLLKNVDFKKIIRMPDKVFPNVKVETIIITFTKQKRKNNACEVIIFPAKSNLKYINPVFAKKHYNLASDVWESAMPPSLRDFKEKKAFKDEILPLSLVNQETKALLAKIEQNSILLGEPFKESPSEPSILLTEFSLGITPYDKYRGHKDEQIKNKIFHSKVKKDENYKPLLKGGDIVPFGVFWNGEEYIKYGPWLGAPREERFFNKKHIIIRQIISGNPPRIYAGYCENEALYNTQIGFNIIIKDETKLSYLYLLGLLNSKLLNFYHKNKFLDETKVLFQKILIQNAKKFPVKLISNKEDIIISELVRKQIDLVKDLYQEHKKVVHRISCSFKIPNMSPKLKKYWKEKFDFSDFLDEIQKLSKKSLSLKEQDDLEVYYKDSIKKHNDIKQKLSENLEEIDNFIYDIYKISDVEKNIIKKDQLPE